MFNFKSSKQVGIRDGEKLKGYRMTLYTFTPLVGVMYKLTIPPYDRMIMIPIPTSRTFTDCYQIKVY